MADELPSTWASRDLPILSSALRRLDTGEAWPDLGDLQRDTGLSREQLWAGLNALTTAEPPYLTAKGWGRIRSLGTGPQGTWHLARR